MSDVWNALRAQIEFFSRPFPEAAIALANEHREEVSPHLVAAIARVADDPEAGADPELVLHIYAMELLASWRETTAYVPLVRLGHHSEEVVERLLGDVVTESYGRCLASVCDGDNGPLVGLVEDAEASHWARHAALDALLTRVLEGDAPREELIAYLTRLGDAEAVRLRALHGDYDDLQILDSVVSTATDLGASEMLERIRTWFDDEILDPTIADLPWIEKHISRPYELCRTEALERGRGYVHSVSKEIGWWAGFADDTPVVRLAQVREPIRSGPKTGRNDPCPCGSGKKFKKCCGA